MSNYGFRSASRFRKLNRLFYRYSKNQNYVGSRHYHFYDRLRVENLAHPQRALGDPGDVSTAYRREKSRNQDHSPQTTADLGGIHGHDHNRRGPYPYFRIIQLKKCGGSLMIPTALLSYVWHPPGIIYLLLSLNPTPLRRHSALRHPLRQI